MIFFLIILFSFLLFATIILALFSKNEIKGYFGEFIVKIAFFLFLGSRFKILNNITISRAGSNKTTQIDHIVISDSIVFVIETKNMSGTIYGKKDEAVWTQEFNDFSRRSFLNPIIQNDVHIYALCKMFKIKKQYVKNIVLFISPKTSLIQEKSNIFTLFSAVKYIRDFKHIKNENNFFEIYNQLKHF